MTTKDIPSILELLQGQIETVIEAKKNETPIERYQRTKKLLPPPNNPHTKAGKAWFRAESKRREERNKKEKIAESKAVSKRLIKLQLHQTI